MFGNAANHLLLDHGAVSLVGRHLVVLIASYFFFFLVIRVWLRVHEESDTLTGIVRPPNKPPHTRTDMGPLWLEPFNLMSLGFTWSIILGALLAIALVFWSGYYLLGEGAIILAETAIEYAVFAGLVRAAKKQNQVWYEHLFKHTIKPFMIVLVVSTTAIFFADRSCPGRNMLSSIFEKCWFPEQPVSYTPFGKVNE